MRCCTSCRAVRLACGLLHAPVPMRLPALLLVLASACTVDPPTTEVVSTDPNAGLLRDFLDGKFDSAGHPLNANVVEAERVCAGDIADGAVRLAAPCTAALHASQTGPLVASARIRVISHPDAGDVVRIVAASPDSPLATDTLTVDRLRGDGWLDLSISWDNTGPEVSLTLAPAPGVTVDVDYVEMFPERFGL